MQEDQLCNAYNSSMKSYKIVCELSYDLIRIAQDLIVRLLDLDSNNIKCKIFFKYVNFLTNDVLRELLIWNKHYPRHPFS